MGRAYAIGSGSCIFAVWMCFFTAAAAQDPTVRMGLSYSGEVIEALEDGNLANGQPVVVKLLHLELEGVQSRTFEVVRGKEAKWCRGFWEPQAPADFPWGKGVVGSVSGRCEGIGRVGGMVTWSKVEKGDPEEITLILYESGIQKGNLKTSGLRLFFVFQNLQKEPRTWNKEKQVRMDWFLRFLHFNVEWKSGNGLEIRDVKTAITQTNGKKSVIVEWAVKNTTNRIYTVPYTTLVFKNKQGKPNGAALIYLGNDTLGANEQQTFSGKAIFPDSSVGLFGLNFINERRAKAVYGESRH